MGVSLKDVSKATGVSQVSVSRALRGLDGVSEARRREIVDAAERLGYCPERNFNARQLRQSADTDQASRTGSICVILPMSEITDRQSFFGELFAGISEAMDATDLEAAYVNLSNEGFPLLVQRQLVDGVIRMPAEAEWQEKNPLVCPVPAVSLIMPDPSGKSDEVHVDNFRGGHEIGRHLSELGHRRVAFVGSDNQIGHERLAGLRAALGPAGGQVPESLTVMRRGIGSSEGVGRFFEAFLHDIGGVAELRRACTAIAVYNDSMAAAVMTRLQAHGCTVPKDFSITGFDHALPVTQEIDGELTTAAIPLADLGAEAVRLMRWRLEHPEAPQRRMLLPVEFVAGTTTAPPVEQLNDQG